MGGRVSVRVKFTVTSYAGALVPYSLTPDALTPYALTPNQAGGECAPSRNAGCGAP